MKLFHRTRPWIMLGALASLSIIAGCEPGSSRTTVVPTPTPEESFEEIVSIFSRGVVTGVGGIPGGFLSRQENGHSRLTVNNTVSHEVIPPANQDEPYRATITVISTTSYSLQRSPTDDAEADDRGQSDQRSRDNGAEVFDPGLVSAAPAAGGGGAGRPSSAGGVEEVVARRTDAETKTYELVHRNGRWELITAPDPKTEQSIINAFERALQTQV